MLQPSSGLGHLGEFALGTFACASAMEGGGASGRPSRITGSSKGLVSGGPASSRRPRVSRCSPSPTVRQTCLRPGSEAFPEESFSVGRPSNSVSLYTESTNGASADTPIWVPMPNASIGAPPPINAATSCSSSPPLAKTLACGRPASSRSVRAAREQRIQVAAVEAHADALA